MNKYIEQNMQFDEEVVLEPRIHWCVYVDTYFLFSIIFIAFCAVMHSMEPNLGGMEKYFRQAEVLVGIAVVLKITIMWIRCSSVEMAVTNYRVIYKIGFFNIKREELENKRIEGVEVRQSLMGRMLNYGDIWFSGTGTSKVAFRKVYAPWRVKQTIEEYLHAVV